MASHLYEIVRERAARSPGAVALGSQDGLIWRTVDSQELLSLGDRVAAELAAEDVGESDRAPIVAGSNGRLAQHQRLASASWWPEADFPRTSTLKVRRHLLPPPDALQAVTVDAFDEAGLAGWFGILSLGLYPLRQYGEQDVSLRGLAKLAQGGAPILIFPQGKHIHPEAERAGDEDARFRPGVGHIAAALDAVVAPFGTAGTEEVFPNVERSRLMVGDIAVALRKGALAIAFGPPIGLEPEESPAAFTRRLQDICFALTRDAEQALRVHNAKERHVAAST